MKYNLKRVSLGLTAMLLFGNGFTPITIKAADFGKFSDGKVMASHWAKADVNYALDHGWLSGKKDGNSTKIDVNGIITRAEYVKMAYDIIDPGFKRYNGDAELVEMLNEGTYANFPDWYKEYAKRYITMGNRFGENTVEDWKKPITRSEMANTLNSLEADLARGEYLEEAKHNIENNISDRNKYDGMRIGWGGIEKMYSNGIMTGKENNAFKPLDNATRGEACAVLRRFVDKNARLKVVVQQDKAEDRYDYTNGENKTLNQSDKYRRSVKEGDTFIDSNGKSWKVTLNSQTGTYNPTDAVGFDLGRENSLGNINGLTGISNGTAGGKKGDRLVQAPNGHINWTSEFEKIYASEFDKPTVKGKKDGDLSPNKYWVWSTLIDDAGEWLQNSDFMFEF